MGSSGLFRVLAERSGRLTAIKKGSAYLQLVSSKSIDQYHRNLVKQLLYFRQYTNIGLAEFLSKHQSEKFPFVRLQRRFHYAKKLFSI